MKSKSSKIKIFAVAITEFKKGPIRPIDYPNGEFVVDRNELLLDFMRRVGFPAEKANRITLPEWGIVSTDLSGKIKEYDIRDGDAVYICCYDMDTK